MVMSKRGVEGERGEKVVRKKEDFKYRWGGGVGLLPGRADALSVYPRLSLTERCQERGGRGKLRGGWVRQSARQVGERKESERARDKEGGRCGVSVFKREARHLWHDVLRVA